MYDSKPLQTACRRLALMLVAAAALGGLARSAQGADEGKRPNVVLIVADDLGWTDLGLMYDLLERRQRFYETPHIDRLAAESVLFTDAYSNGPNCAPSRACLMSGQYAPRHGVYTVGTSRRGKARTRKLEPIENETVLADSIVTLAEVLQSAGYATASMGKWHLGDDPTTQGFDLNVAGRQWGSPSGGGYHSPLNYPNLKVDEPGVYLTDALTERATAFLEANREKPFFLFLTHYAVHTPLQGKADLVAKYRVKPPSEHHRHATYAAMIESLDDSVGAVLAKLDELQLSDNTVVIFVSDNGGYGGATSNHPLRGAKGMLYEGGIRVPLIIRWPGVGSPGGRCAEPVTGVDLYPTLLEAVGAESPAGQPLDGASLVPLLREPAATLGREAVYWHFPCYLEGSGDPHGGPFRTTPAGAVRLGEWKLIEWFESGRLELYNLRDDLGEQHNLAETNVEQRDRLHAVMKRWRSEIQAPVPETPNAEYDPAAETPRRRGRR